jgi:hypothetical protein
MGTPVPHPNSRTLAPSWHSESTAFALVLSRWLWVSGCTKFEESLPCSQWYLGRGIAVFPQAVVLRIGNDADNLPSPHRKRCFTKDASNGIVVAK